jgi:hypothetical protein
VCAIDQARNRATAVQWRDSRHAIEKEADRKYAAFRAVSGRLDETLAAAIREGRAVSKLSAMGQRIAQKKAAHDRKADEWAHRLDAIEKKNHAHSQSATL